MVKISIVMPTYKRHPNIVSKSINSVLNQTYRNVEIILVDENAKPELLDYRRQIEQMVVNYNDPRIILVKNSINLGPSLARNKGIEMSRGEYLAFLDDDDLFMPTKIENMLNCMLKNALDVCFSPYYICDKDYRIFNIRKYPEVVDTALDYMLKYHLTYQIIPTSTYMLKLDSIRSKGIIFKDIIPGEDFRLIYDAIKSGLKVGMLNEYNALYVQHDLPRVTSETNGGDQLADPTRMIIEENFHLLNWKQKRLIQFSFYYSKINKLVKTKSLSKELFFCIGASLFTYPINTLKASFLILRKKCIIKKINSDMELLSIIERMKQNQIVED